MEIIELATSLALIDQKEATRLVNLLDHNEIIGKRDRSFLKQKS